MNRQNRKPPAYQEYPAEMMAHLGYRRLTLAQRGLLYTLRLECWVNRGLPEEPATLAHLLAYDLAEIEADLPHVMQFFKRENGSIMSPDLEDYRTYLERKRERQSEGGKATQAKRSGRKSSCGTDVQSNAAQLPSRPTAKLPSEHSAPVQLLSTAQPNPAQPSQGEESLIPLPVSKEAPQWSDFTLDPEDDGGDA